LWPQDLAEREAELATARAELTGARIVDPAQLSIGKTPIDLLCQSDQRMPHVDDLVQCRPERLLLTTIPRLRHPINELSIGSTLTNAAIHLGQPKGRLQSAQNSGRARRAQRLETLATAPQKKSLYRAVRRERGGKIQSSKPARHLLWERNTTASI
jgi:hypothetical protein